MRILLPLASVTVMAASITLMNWRSAPARQGFSAGAATASLSRVSAPGVVEGASESLELRPEVTGRVAEKGVDAGDWVTQGQVLLVLNNRPQQAQLAAARAELAIARAQLRRLLNGARQSEKDETLALAEAAQERLQNSELTLRRVQELERGQAVAVQVADDTRAEAARLRAELAAASARVQQITAPAREDEVELAKARIAAAQAGVEVAQANLERTTLTAPASGQVLDVSAGLGEIVSSGDAAPTIVLADTSRCRVRAFVEELDAASIGVGMAAEITADGLPGRTFEGVITEISPRMERKRRRSNEPNELYDVMTREVLLDVPESDGLIFGMRVDVMIHNRSARPRPQNAAVPITTK